MTKTQLNLKIKSLSFSLWFSMIFICSIPLFGQTEGYYKDLFMDGGANLTSRTTLPAADALDLDWEFIATEDEALQSQIIIENRYDENGFLLYPDGAPRFAMIYTNGGSATNHGNSMGEQGRNRVREFYYNGGSYSGSCAGAYIASLSYMTTGTYTPYYHIWPGRTEPTNLGNTYTGHFIPLNSPIFNYFDFGGDAYIENVYHNGGCTIRENIDFPEGTQILLNYDYPGLPIHNRPSCWAYKENAQSGRVVVIGSHPEGATSGEPYNLMKVIFLYALDGVGDPQLKSELHNGQIRYMDKSTSDDDPAFTKVGDRQYHHFKINIPEDSENLNISVNGDDAFNLSVYLNQGDFAFKGISTYEQTGLGADKVIEVQTISPGEWYIGVKCETTVEAVKQSWGYSYTANQDVLNGVAYTISAKWDTSATGFVLFNRKPVQFNLAQNYPNPFNSSTTIEYVLPSEGMTDLSIFDINGKYVRTIVHGIQTSGKKTVHFDAGNLASGIYFYRISFQNEPALTRRFIKVD